MSVTTRRLARTPRRARRRWSQARRRYQLRNPQPTPLRAYRIPTVREGRQLISGLFLALVAVYLWRVLPWH